MNEHIIIDNDIVSQLISKIDKLLLINNKPKKEDLMRIDEVCEMLNINERTVHNLKKSRILGYTTLGKSVYIKRSEIMKVLEKNYIPPLKSLIQ
jgi:excisionase family DNA binding protein